MIDFEEELKRFRPSTEIGEVEKMIGAEDLTDMMDLVIQLFGEKPKQPEN